MRGLRVPVTALVCLTMLPLAPVAWIALSGSDREAYLQSTWVRAGFRLAGVSVLPLLTVVVADSLGVWPDPNPNPIGFGLLFVFGGALAAVFLTVGIVSVARRPTRPSAVRR